MRGIDREERIKELLASKRKLKLSETVDYFDISESTVRRIFKRMEDSGVALRTHGGLVQIPDPIPAYSFEFLVHANYAQKSAIGHRAAMEADSGDILYIDSGTTAFSMCMELASLLQAGKLRDIQIFTNSLANLETLSPVVPVGLIGGRYRENRKDFAGYISEAALKDLHFTKCFLGADGIMVPDSFTATDFETATLNQIAALNSDKVYILSDSSKFGKVSLVSFANASSVDVIITDDKVSSSFTGAFHDVGVEVAVSGDTAGME